MMPAPEAGERAEGGEGEMGEGQEGEVRPMLKVAKLPFEMIVIDPRSRRESRLKDSARGVEGSSRSLN
jgi:hypothetical protein